MKYTYEYRFLQMDEEPIKIATDMGKHGWRWVNAPSVSVNVDGTNAPFSSRVMIFELAEKPRRGILRD